TSKKQLWQTRIKSGSSGAVRCLRRRIPILTWLVSNPGYNWKAHLTQDLFAGVTISAVIMPQSMAYAMLASLPPVHGLYTSLAPTVLYTVFGTSRHMSTGTFAITSLLLGQFAHKILSEQGYSDDISPDGEYQRRYLPICLMLTFLVGVIQILLSMARLGRWTSKHLLPIALVSGFNTASAFHIGTHQLKHLLGMKPPREGGIFSMIKTWVWIIQHFWSDTAWPTLAMGLAAMALMYILQRIEYRRRSHSGQIVRPSITATSPHPSAALTTFPCFARTISSPCISNTTQSAYPSLTPSPVARSTCQRGVGVHGTSMKRPAEQCKRSIVPKAVSDQALLTPQDVALENAEFIIDSDSSPYWSPVLSPRRSLEQPGILDLQTSTSQTSTEPARPVIITSVGFSSPHLHNPVSPGTAGLTNTGAFGHRQERTRSQRIPSTPRTYRYKSFRSPATSTRSKRRMLEESEDEQEPLLDNAHISNGSYSRRGSACTVSPVSEAEECYSGSDSMVYAGYGCESPALGTCSHAPESEEAQHAGRCRDLLSRLVPTVHFPIPDIFICVIIFTVVTVVFDLDRRYQIEVIGFIPTGLPTMTWPLTMIDPWSAYDWIPLIWPGILMAMVVYVISLSVAKHFGREYGYEIDADQEMLALGVGSLVGSCFGGYVGTGSLTRSAILAQLGAKTPLASLVGAFMVLMSLLWLTVLFERIPDTILAAIVLVALKALLAHTIEAKRLWRVGRRKEALIWWITFTSVILFSIEVGLAVGMATVVLFKVYKNGSRWKRTLARSMKQSATYQRIMLLLGLQSPLFTTSGRGLYTGDDEDDY
ncbi:hypothetical protein BGZ54_009771, partial [Gamsiella multidivaricata]